MRHSSITGRVALLLMLEVTLVGAATAAPVEPVATVEISGAGELRVHPNADLLQRMGLSLGGRLDDHGTLRSSLQARKPLQVELGDGAPTRIRPGSIASSLQLVRRDGERTPAFDLVPAVDRPLDWDLVDGDGRLWLRVSHGMRSPDLAAHGVTLFSSDLRVGPALAEWAGAGEAGQLLGNASLQLGLRVGQLLPPTYKAGEKSCAVPNWPGTPGFITDVHLTNIDGIDVLRCRRSTFGSCDGPGGDPGEVVYVPSATLRNSTELNASEVPWYEKFSGNSAPYGNDQHPYLVWNMYRIDAAGNLDQIARSGLKHAFATTNQGCSEPCAGSRILGRGCSDLYNSGSNDLPSALSPRAEIIPSQGLWGRCMSVYDDGLNASGAGTPACDGVFDVPPQDDAYRHRLVLRETDIEPVSNTGAIYFIDAWYVVRDDQNIFNTMGSRTLQPQFTGGGWRTGPIGAFTPGPVIDRWIEAAPVAVIARRFDFDTPEGRVGVALRVTPLKDGAYRYDYAIMNFDLTRAVTNGASPNLQIIRNLAISALQVELAGGAVSTLEDYRDGDTSAANDWTTVSGASAVDWTAPAGEHLEWGRLVSLSLTSQSPPGEGQVSLTMAEAGSPASYSITALVPNGAGLFRSGFE